MLDEYYLSRGWDAEGRPSERKLRSLGLPSASVADPERPAPRDLADVGPGVAT